MSLNPITGRRSEPNSGVVRAKPRPWPFAVWLACFYACWAGVVLLGGWGGEMLERWPIAAAMTLGSYVAGATPMGGGTVAFPILVLLFDHPASVGRGFSFAAQATGMTSAAIFIFATGRPVAVRLLGWTMLGSAVGVPLGLAFLTPMAPEIAVKVTFAVLWASFGVMTIRRVFEFSRVEGVTPVRPSFDRTWGLGLGLLGGACVAAVTGVGIEMLVYTSLVLVRRADLKIAIPTAVTAAAFASLIGLIATVVLHRADPVRHPLDPEVFYSWLAAAPIIVLGAPFGSFMMSVIPRTWTLLFVAALSLGQFVWVGTHSRLSGAEWALAVGGVALANVLFIALRRFGLRLSAGAASAAATR